jgi:hypothetical protein
VSALRVIAVLVLWSAGAMADSGPMTITARETALAATLDLEFQDAVARGVNGAVILEQDGKVALRASHGVTDTSGMPFSPRAADEFYARYRAVAVPSVTDGSDRWTVRRADDGHIVQISRTETDRNNFRYFCRRPDDGTVLVLVTNSGSAASGQLLDRMLVSLRDYGKMPLTNMH